VVLGEILAPLWRKEVELLEGETWCLKWGKMRIRKDVGKR